MGFFNSWKLLMPSSLTLVERFTTSLLAVIAAELALIASRFLRSTVVSEHAVLLRIVTARAILAAVLVMALTLRSLHRARDFTPACWFGEQGQRHHTWLSLVRTF